MKEVVEIRDLQSDNIDLVQGAEEVKEFCDAAGYDNDDDYDYAYVVWDKKRTGNIKAVYGSYTPNLDDTAYIMRQIK